MTFCRPAVLYDYPALLLELYSLAAFPVDNVADLCSLQSVAEYIVNCFLALLVA